MDRAPRPWLHEGRQRPPVQFARDVLPILSENYFTCHGPDEQQRKADLRFDTPDGPRAELPGGDRAVVPGESAGVTCTPPQHKKIIEISAAVEWKPYDPLVA